VLLWWCRFHVIEEGSNPSITGRCTPLSTAQPITNTRQDRKNTQRERILAGMIDGVARDGYTATTIAQVITHAGVSRPTFYEYFKDKNDCFVATLETIQDRLNSKVHRAVDQDSPDRATHAVAAALVGFAQSQPAMARVLLDEAMSGGSRALDVRDQGIAALERLIEARYHSTDSAAVPDLPARTLIGGIYRLLASRLRNGQLGAAGLLEKLLVWIDCYALPLRDHRWRTLHPASPHTPVDVAESPLKAPPSLGPVHAHPSSREVAENQRQLILLAAAHLAEQKGFQATTITDITKHAGVDKRVFYRLFADKLAAFQALHELLFRHIMAVTASGSVAGDSWPERVWEAGRAFALYMEQNPTLAYTTFVDSHAGSAAMVQRVEQLVGGFTIFLQEGYRYNAQAGHPSSVALQAITTTVFELDYMQVRQCRVGQLSGLLPHVTFISLAPFIGAAASNEFIDSKLEGAS
jgi:TetR/AcrR family transcriptional regulator